MQIAVDELEKYRPVEEVRATTRVKGEIVMAKEALASAKVAEREAEIASKRAALEREIEITKKTVARLKMNVKYNKTGTKKKELEEKQILLRNLRTTLEGITE